MVCSTKAHGKNFVVFFFLGMQSIDVGGLSLWFTPCDVKAVGWSYENEALMGYKGYLQKLMIYIYIYFFVASSHFPQFSKCVQVVKNLECAYKL